MKTLIAYYSKKGDNWYDSSRVTLKKGNTQVVAEKLAKLLNADLFEIKMKEPYEEDYDRCCDEALRDQKENKRPELMEDIDITEYDTILIGYPIYWSSCPMVILSFVRSKNFTKRNVHLFSTHEGSGMGDSRYVIEKENETIQVKSCLPVIGTLCSKSDEELHSWVKAFQAKN
jgi:flavodoxin